MLKKIAEKAKNLLIKGKETIFATIGAILIAYETMPLTVYAASSYTQPLTNLKTVLVTIATAAGVILVVYGAIRFAIAFQKMDQNGEHSAIYTIIAGGVLVGISAVLTALGV